MSQVFSNIISLLVHTHTTVIIEELQTEPLGFSKHFGDFKMVSIIPLI